MTFFTSGGGDLYISNAAAVQNIRFCQFYPQYNAYYYSMHAFFGNEIAQLLNITKVRIVVSYLFTFDFSNSHRDLPKSNSVEAAKYFDVSCNLQFGMWDTCFPVISVGCATFYWTFEMPKYTFKKKS